MAGVTGNGKALTSGSRSVFQGDSEDIFLSWIHCLLIFVIKGIALLKIITKLFKIAVTLFRMAINVLAPELFL